MKIRTVSKVEEMIGKKYYMEVANDVNLNIQIVNNDTVVYQFVGLDDNTQDPKVIRKLEVAYDYTDSEFDYSFTDLLGGRFYLFQFEELGEMNA